MRDGDHRPPDLRDAGLTLGISHSPQQLNAKIRAFTAGMEPAARRGVRAGGLFVTKSIERQLAADVPSKRLRSGAKHGRSTARALSVRMDDLHRIADNPGVFISARGPWQVFERDTKPHTIMSKAARRDVGRALRSLSGQGGRGKFRRSTSKRSRVLAYNGRFSASVKHPGTQGKGTFAKGVARAVPVAPKLFEREIAQEMGKVFR